MVTLTIIGIVIFILTLFYLTIKHGSQNSISSLAQYQKWLVLVALWSQILVLPQMIQITPEVWKWLPFIGIGGIIICGGANIKDKNDELIHMICAIVSFICFVVWTFILNKYCLLPLLMCIIADKDKLKWRAEIGLITSVYLILILSI